ncbi:MAG: sugar ABC transporter permease [Spirochaetales bacterium]|nr:sugar ABC transporter permease [Spirochaetales bacterium]
MKTPLNSVRFEKHIAPYIFILPMMLGLFVFRLGPVVWSFLLSFQKYNPFQGGGWIGLENYRELIQDKEFHQIFLNTLKFTLWYLPLGVLTSLVLAVLVDNKLRGIVLFRAIYFLPVISAVAAIGTIWAWLLNPLYGLVNFLIKTIFGITGPEWLGSPRTALFTIVLVNVWRNMGYTMVIFLAGLQGVPPELLDAAWVDGAGKIRRFFQVVLPLLSPTTFFVIIITIIRSFQIFDLVYILTAPAAGEGGTVGGPAGSTNVLVISIFLNAFKYYRMGYGAAQAYILFVMVAVITAIQFRFQKRWVHYQ